VTAYRVPSRVAYVVADEHSPSAGTVYLMTLPDGQPAVLRGSGAVIWVVAAEGEDDVAGAVAELVGMPVEEVSAEVERFLDELVELGVLEVDDVNDAAPEGS
jgi:hypothetical protein